MMKSIQMDRKKKKISTLSYPLFRTSHVSFCQKTSCQDMIGHEPYTYFWYQHVVVVNMLLVWKSGGESDTSFFFFLFFFFLFFFNLQGFIWNHILPLVSFFSSMEDFVQFSLEKSLKKDFHFFFIKYRYAIILYWTVEDSKSEIIF